MKMALSEFVLREKGIYGILHVIILILSLFLVCLLYTSPHYRGQQNLQLRPQPEQGRANAERDYHRRMGHR